CLASKGSPTRSISMFDPLDIDLHAIVVIESEDEQVDVLQDVGIDDSADLPEA
ncbi:hypothetical protein AMTR_s00117p00075630, partial [Amborella trichopoda]